jgi:hypothetical protein
MAIELRDIKLRPSIEIQAAHDRIMAILLGEVPNPFENPYWLTSLKLSASVLCWVLKHDGDRGLAQLFSQTLSEIDSFMAAHGFELWEPDDSIKR